MGQRDGYSLVVGETHTRMGLYLGLVYESNRLQIEENCFWDNADIDVRFVFW